MACSLQLYTFYNTEMTDLLPSYSKSYWDTYWHTYGVTPPASTMYTGSTSTSTTTSNYCPYLHTCQAIKSANPSDLLFQHWFVHVTSALIASYWKEKLTYKAMCWPVIGSKFYTLNACLYASRSFLAVQNESCWYHVILHSLYHHI